MNPLLDLNRHGQSAWIDYIRRSLLEGGGLARLVEQDGVAGVTSNPSIFEKAIGGSADYDGQLRQVIEARPGIDNDALFEALALDDIRAAADVLRPVFDRTGGADGFVSFEVPASVAGDTEATIAHARRLWRAIDRPNAMIKVPATPAGIPAVERLTADGINVNVTLMFSLEHYEQVAQAYLRGLARCAAPSRVSSVASFFVSRVDTVVDQALERIGTPEALALRGKAAIANSRLVYARFRQLFHGQAFAPLRDRGGRVQRPLWASTSTKNPAYRDVVYVEELIAAETVNTIPPATLDAFRDHGRVRGATAEEDLARAREVLEALARFGIDLGEVTESLQRDGVAAFAQSYVDLLGSLERKRARLARERIGAQGLSLGAVQDDVDRRLAAWQRDGVGRRVWARDHTVWSATPRPELSDRLGWLSLPGTAERELGDWMDFAAEIRDEGFRHVVLLGMGGSSLAPEVLRDTFGVCPGYPRLLVLDSTHPDSVRATGQEIDLARTLFLVSSKSGSTSETMAFYRHFWARLEPGGRPGRQFGAITDAGSPLDGLARERGFRRIFNAPPDVGGRYSALSAFGLVPAALIGVDLRALTAHACWFVDACAPGVLAAENPALVLGAALGELALAGRDKLTLLAGRPFESLPAWLEQLVAESTGKDGRGIVPVADEPVFPAEAYGRDRVFVVFGLEADSRCADRAAALRAAGHPVITLALKGAADLGQEFFRWELAIAAAGAVLGIQPFDQPDVQLAKDMARRAMAGNTPGQSGARPESDPLRWRSALDAWMAGAKPGDYIGVQAYLHPSTEVRATLQEIRAVLTRRTGLATTLGFGPRFLHSTGQLHKGGADNGLFLQITDVPADDIEVPGAGHTFGALIAAQAAGDAMALEQRGRRVLRVSVGRRGAGALAELLKAAG